MEIKNVANLPLETASVPKKDGVSVDFSNPENIKKLAEWYSKNGPDRHFSGILEKTDVPVSSLAPIASRFFARLDLKQQQDFVDLVTSSNMKSEVLPVKDEITPVVKDEKSVVSSVIIVKPTNVTDVSVADALDTYKKTMELRYVPSILKKLFF